jgi:hypothetical protein
MATAASVGDFHLGEGGALKRFEVRCHLTSLVWQIVWFVLVTWVPIMVFGAFGAGAHPLFLDAGLHVRLLVVGPVLLFLDLAFPRLCNRALLQLSTQGFVPDAAQPRLQRTLQSATRLADSPLPELAIAALSISLSVGSFLRHIPLSAHGLRDLLTAAEIWYTLVALPLFEFLLLRSLWRWVIWVRVLVGISRIDLELDPTHPDHRGGISFLRFPSIGYCEVLLFAIASVLSAEWQGRVELGTTLASFAPMLLAFVTVATLVAFGPLLAFTPQLVRARHTGRIQVAGVAIDLGRRFKRRWVDRTEVARPDDLSADAQGLAAVGATYRDCVERLRWLLFDRYDLVSLVIAAAAPVVPLMIARVPGEDWFALLGTLTGGIGYSP